MTGNQAATSAIQQQSLQLYIYMYQENLSWLESKISNVPAVMDHMVMREICAVKIHHGHFSPIL